MDAQRWIIFVHICVLLKKTFKAFIEVGSSYLLLCPVVKSWDTSGFWWERSTAPLPQTHSIPRSRSPDLSPQQTPAQHIKQLSLPTLNINGFPVYQSIFLEINCLFSGKPLKNVNIKIYIYIKNIYDTLCTFSVPVALTDVCVTCCLNMSSIRTQRKRDGPSVPSSWLRMGKRLCSGTWGRASIKTCMICATTVSIWPSDWALPPSWACGKTRIKNNAICNC